MFLCVLYHSHNNQSLIFPSTSLQWDCNMFLSVQMGFVVVNVTLGKVLQILISFICLRRYITLATEDIVK